MTKLELISIATASGSLELDAKNYTKLELISIAKSLSNGATLSLRNAGSKTKLELISIAKAKTGAVSFYI